MQANLDDMLTMMSASNSFSALDATNIYFHKELYKDNQLLTTFNSPYERLGFQRVAFRLLSLQDIIQGEIDQSFEGISNVSHIAGSIKINDAYEFLQCTFTRMCL